MIIILFQLLINRPFHLNLKMYINRWKIADCICQRNLATMTRKLSVFLFKIVNFCLKSDNHVLKAFFQLRCLRIFPNYNFCLILFVCFKDGIRQDVFLAGDRSSNTTVGWAVVNICLSIRKKMCKFITFILFLCHWPLK